MSDVTDDAARAGHRGVRDADEQAARRDRERAPGGAHRPAGGDRRRRSRRQLVGRGRRSACAKAVEQRRRAPRLGQGRVALGRPRASPEIGDRLGWLDDLRRDARARRRARRVRARARRATDFTRRGAARDGRLEPRARGALADVRRARGRARPARARLDRPGAILAVQERDRPRAHAVRRLDEVGRHDRDALAVRALPLAACRDGSRFIAITDPGSSLLELAREHGFRAAFENDPNIGGRYSALSLFGLVPAALIGAPVHALLERAAARRAGLRALRLDARRNPGPVARRSRSASSRAHGRDKLTFVVGDPVASFGLWVEQLVAESTGKHGRGILPVADEPLLDPRPTATDRVFVHLRDAERADADTDARVERARRGRAIRRSRSPSTAPRTSGGMFFLAEFATAVAGWVLEINPFDQPNVAGGQGRDQARCSPRDRCPTRRARRRRGAARRCSRGGDAGGYIALMGYVAPSLEFDEAVAELRATLMRAPPARDDVRLRPALPALDRPAAQGRAAGRALPLADRRRGARTSRSRGRATRSARSRPRRRSATSRRCARTACRPRSSA